MRRRTNTWKLFLLILALSLLSLQGQNPDPRLKKAARRPPQNGWTTVHLEGTPAEIGFQHGYLLAVEIDEMKRIAALELKHDTTKDWSFFRDAGRDMMWPHIEAQYREELQGIAEGLQARGNSLDLWDIVALNGLLEWNYYIKVLDRSQGIASPATVTPGDHCSAFVATGSHTKDGRVVIAHNNWSGYLEGARWTVVFDIVPAQGNRVLMDGLPGLISSGDDFGLNAAGLIITETTITAFEGYDPAGIPEFVRARKAMQYAASIDEFAQIMKQGNNGGYANDWLIADRKTNEIAHLELGLKNVTLERTRDGFFVGANFPKNPKLTSEETRFNTTDLSNSGNARRLRWEQLMSQFRGRIDLAAAKRFLADHFDAYQQKMDPNERTLCGHVELSPRGMPDWQAPYGMAGAVQNKAADAALAERMSFAAAAGHSCGLDFKADAHLKAHPEFNWQKPYLRDMPSRRWTIVQTIERGGN